MDSLELTPGGSSIGDGRENEVFSVEGLNVMFPSIPLL